MLQELGGDLVCVLDQLKVKLVVGLGEGAGANILARWVHYEVMYTIPKKMLTLRTIWPTTSTLPTMSMLPMTLTDIEYRAAFCNDK